MSVPYSSRKAIAVNGLTNATIAPTPTDNDVLTYKSVSNSWVNQAVVSGSATSVDITDNNTSTTLFPTLVDGTGANKILYADATTTPFAVNPNTGKFGFGNTIDIQGNGGTGSMDIGLSAGLNSTATNRVALGFNAGFNAQSTEAVAIGHEAGSETQGVGAVAIGNLAGSVNQSSLAGIGASIAIGQKAGQTDQSSSSVAIGFNAGNSRQGRNSIAIGSNSASTNQPNGQIDINSSGLATTGIQVGACYITQLRGVALGLGAGVVYYNSLASGIGSGDSTT